MKEPPPVLLHCDFPLLDKPQSGKVRENFDFGDRLLMVATDRISAFDVILPNGIPKKGPVLNKISALWLPELADIIPNHFISCDPAQYPKICWPYAKELLGRSMLVKKAKPLPIEAVVRGYLAGSGWKEYRQKQSVCGIKLPPRLVESEELPDGPIFTPATKAGAGAHDENITLERAATIVGPIRAQAIKEVSLKLYIRARGLALRAGIIIADTKFEFGLVGGKLILIDEVLTPDSSRFWPVDSYKPGGPQPSFDKQYVRDWLESIKWNKQPPAPKLPPRIIKRTSEKYLEALRRLTKVLTK